MHCKLTSHLLQDQRCSPQKAITALGTLNLDRLRSFSADSRNKDRAHTPHQNSGNYLFSQIEYTYKGRLITPSHNEMKNLISIRITYCTIPVRVRVSIHYGVRKCKLWADMRWEEGSVLPSINEAIQSNLWLKSDVWLPQGVWYQSNSKLEHGSTNMILIPLEPFYYLFTLWID